MNDHCDHIERGVAMSGTQVEVTQFVKQFADTVEGGPQDIGALVSNIFSHKFKIGVSGESSQKGSDFRRTADEILRGVFNGQMINGCNEAGVLLIAILKAKGCQGLSYVQCFDREAVKNYSSQLRRKGHVFVWVGNDNEGVYINSTSGQITDTIPPKYVEDTRGVDAWSIGYKGFGMETMHQRFLEMNQRMTE